jgi:N-methylhydantoinase B
LNIDPISFSIIWDRMISTCNEQVTALVKTSFSPVVREAGDLAAGLFDIRGRMLCQPITGTPGHINPLSVGVKNMLREIPVSAMRPGDVLITNDPWLTTGQLLDVTVLVPIFQDQEPVACFAATCHMVDIGGFGPGTGASDVYEEGLQIPVMHLRREGVMDRTLERILAANIRDPEHFFGDLDAMVNSCYVGGEKLLALMQEYNLRSLDEVGDEILSRSQAAQREALRKLPEGRYRGELITDGFDEPIRLACTVEIQDGKAAVDFTGTSPESRHGVNVVLNYTAGYATFAIRSATAPEIPNNDGCMGQITVTAPKGCILNAQRPSPTSGRHLVGQFVTETVLNALRNIIADRVPAEGAGAISTVEVRGGEGDRQFTLFITISGGMGARASKDGLNTVSFPACIAGVPVEIWETTVPVLIHRRELRQDSGGAGCFRGGLGQLVELSVPAVDRWIANIMTDRNRFPARGVAGGCEGALGRVQLGNEGSLPPKGRVILGRGDVLRLATAGGGGWGPPDARDPERVRSDVLEGYVSRRVAEEVYGVSLTEAGEVDVCRTNVLRSKVHQTGRWSGGTKS